ncbi:spore coat protein GerQ [Halalkalibacter krulwichiae]|uniref:Spore coat protein GerQ n=1 Tax=Halalkalibacter krulwichiae TaxID=199441 RepID=A0A1X9MHB5_9BACI|nr:spore coat protein GerQ [Halalkalibacter krulwichiae]ARK32816.1 Spore coat protein GerQ [Halalkalibacter krulwichiae]
MYQQPWYPQQQAGTGYGQQQPQMHQQQAGGQMPYQSAQAYQFSQIPGIGQQQQQMTPQQLFAQQQGMLPLEQSFIENILRLNRGKAATFYMTYENNNQWNAKIFRGIVEEAGRDHIVVGDFEDQKHYLLLMVNLDYVEFDEPIEYDYPFGQAAPLATYSPRPNG